MIKVLITWASGFLGRWLVEKLTKEIPDVEIWNLWRTHVEWTHFIDINHDWILSKTNIIFDLIIHTLGAVWEKYCSNFFDADNINVWYTKQILSYTQVYPSTHLIYISSIIIYHNDNKSPVKEEDELNYFYTNYSFSKWIAEEYVRYFMHKHNLSITVLRLANLYWPWQKFLDSPYLISEKIMQAKNEKIVQVRNELTCRDWLYIDDAIDAIIMIFIHKKTGLFNIWSGYGVSVWEIWRIISEKMNVPYESLWLPVTGPQNFFADITKITKEIHWKPKVNIVDWIENQIRFIINNS